MLDNLTLFFMKLVSGWLKKKVREDQLSANNETWNKYLSDEKKLSEIATDIKTKPDGSRFFYIERQHQMSEFLYGEKKGIVGRLIYKDADLTAADNACEVIAVFNALMNMGCYESLPKLLYTFASKGIALNGMFGTDFIRLQKYFDENGFETVRINGNRLTEENLNRIGEDFTAYLFIAFNEGQNPSSMIHTMCITGEIDNDRRVYVRHNSGNMQLYPDLYEAVTDYNGGKGHAISVIGVRKKEKA